MPPVAFEPTIPVSERPQTHALDRAATGIGLILNTTYNFHKTHSYTANKNFFNTSFSIAGFDVLYVATDEKNTEQGL
jgi:hypothetical protein